MTIRVFQPITDRKIRVALVGCGRIAFKHFEAMEKFKDQVELVAICDNQPDRLALGAGKAGTVGYLHLEQMLEKEKLDLVVLATPSGLHARQTIAVARHGVHVMTEKPMATRWQDGLDMVKACDAAGVFLFVVKQNRRNATLQLLKKALVEKRFGRIYMVSSNVFWQRPQSYYDTDAWRGTWEFDGGALMNQASHYVDLFDWMIGPLESVHAYTATLERDIEVEDTAVISMRWRNGALGTMSVTMLTYPNNMEGSFTVLGEKGTVRIGGVAVNQIQRWEFADKRPEDADIQKASYETTSVYGFGHPYYYGNVIDVLQGKCSPETDGREGLRSLELLIAAYRSARDGKRVHLPLEY
jgi:UDP-N-acetyl-2-amino-2-deoxyglucuronate dehydrogenase